MPQQSKQMDQNWEREQHYLQEKYGDIHIDRSLVQWTNHSAAMWSFSNTEEVNRWREIPPWKWLTIEGISSMVNIDRNIRRVTEHVLLLDNCVGCNSTSHICQGNISCNDSVDTIEHSVEYPVQHLVSWSWYSQVHNAARDHSWQVPCADHDPVSLSSSQGRTWIDT